MSYTLLRTPMTAGSAVEVVPVVEGDPVVVVTRSAPDRWSSSAAVRWPQRNDASTECVNTPCIQPSAASAPQSRDV